MNKKEFYQHYLDTALSKKKLKHVIMLRRVIGAAKTFKDNKNG